MKILVVDDEPTARTVLKENLNRLLPTHEVIEAENGAVAVYRLITERPQVVLLDLIMPVANGETFLNILEDLVQRKLIDHEVRVAVVTSFNNAEKLMEISNRPAVDKVIPKPITAATIMMLKDMLS